MLAAFPFLGWIVSGLGGGLTKLLGGPFIKGALDAYRIHTDASNSVDVRTADLMKRELDVQQRELELQSQLKIAEVGHPFEVEKLFAYVALIYFAKLLIWDKCLGWGVTDALHGSAEWTYNIVVSWYFAKRALGEIASTIARRGK